MSDPCNTCHAIGCRAAIYPHEPPRACPCGAPLCPACASVKGRTCGRCESDRRWREAHDLYLDLLRQLADEILVLRGRLGLREEDF